VNEFHVAPTFTLVPPELDGLAAALVTVDAAGLALLGADAAALASGLDGFVAAAALWALGVAGAAPAPQAARNKPIPEIAMAIRCFNARLLRP
jgi:hypothetical protein